MTTTTASQLFAAGYRDLVSVVPPGAKLSPKSDIPDGSDPAKADQRGKAPGKYDGNRGVWSGYNWRELKPFPAHIEQWEKAGANIGLHAKAFPGIDIDCMDPQLVDELRAAAIRVLGPAPCRIGRAPKALLVYATAQPFTRVRLHLKRGDDKGLIEVLGDGQQYLVAGVHPATMNPYEWTGQPLHELDPLDDLSVIDLAKVDAFLEEAIAIADIMGWTCEREGKGRVVAEGGLVQEHLAAPSFEACRAAVAAIPNTTALFPSRDAMNEMGYAIKASVGEPGLELFLEWCSRWADGVNEPEYVQHEWDRCVPPFRLGWEWLLSKAKQLGGYDDAGDEFDAPGGVAPPAPAAAPPAPPDASQAPAGDDGPAPPRYSDYGAAKRFQTQYGAQFRYVEVLGGWMHYSTKLGTWSKDETLKSEFAAQRICADYAELAQTDTTLNPQQRRSVVFALTKAGTITNVLKVARARKPFAGLRVGDFDQDVMRLNTPGGLIDLKTGEVLPHSADNLVTKSAAVAPAPGEPKRWLRFLDEALGGDQELVQYMQTLAGYWLTGDISEQQLVFLWGDGGNGKGVFANTIADVMGDYAKRTASGTFAAKKNDAHPTDMADLRGARLVLASETQEGQAWDEGKIKQATGGDVISARFMGQDFFTYRPQFKLLFLGQHKPRIRSLDAAMKRRIHMVSMTRKPKRVNKKLPDELKAEWPQILQWAIEGCVRWQRDGLVMPKAVVDATQEYFSEEDIIGQFLQESCDASDHNGFTSSMSLWKAWHRWCELRGEHERTQTWLGRQIGARPGIEKVGMHPELRVRGYKGIKLLIDEDFDAPGGPEPAAKKQTAR